MVVSRTRARSRRLYNLARMGRLGATINGWLPQGIFDAVRQLLLFFLVYQGYQVVRGITDGGDEAAFANAERLIDIERSLGAFFEPGFQQTLLGHEWLIDAANFMYMNSHFVITTGFLAWMYLFRNEHFYFVRNMFMVAMGLALAGYALYPTAPPRLMPEEGFTDTIALFTGVAQDDKTVSLLVNQYAAVPSMHIAFSLLVAVPAAALSRNVIARTIWPAYPLLVLFVIVATGNHFWFDAAVGAAVACLAAVGARQLAKLRPNAWSWRSEDAPQEATA
jgi:PAP2 superfamily